MYVPLYVSTHSSIGVSSLKPEIVAQWAQKNGVPAVGLCERNTYAGALENAKILQKAGVHALTGLFLNIQGDVSGHVWIYVRSEEAYRALLTFSNIHTCDPARATLSLNATVAALEAHKDDVVVIVGNSACGAFVQEALTALADFPYVFAGIERDGNGARATEPNSYAAAVQSGRPVVAMPEMVCESAEMAHAHDVYLCVTNKRVLVDASRPQMPAQSWLLTEEEARARYHDIEDAIDNTVVVAQLCAWKITGAAPKMPRYPFVDNEDDALAQKAKDGLAARIAFAQSTNAFFDASAYAPRLEREIKLIQKMGFSGYFLIVTDFIEWARDNRVPVGPGRGSGAGSLVAYALGITNIDPLPFGLLFERFLNPDRVSLPDFDIDFGQVRRDEVIAYVRTRYGEDYVAQIGTWAVLQARAAVRGAGRALSIPYPVCEQYASLIPQLAGNPVSLADLMLSGGLRDELAKGDETMRELFDVACKIEGLYSHMSTHAAGVVISPGLLASEVPMHRDESGALVTTFGMKPVEDSGLVKFDFLGLRNLDIIEEALSFIEERTGKRPDLATLNYEHPKAYASLAKGDGFRVFQVESAGMERAMRDLQIDCVQDLIALISLYRPGPMDQIDTYAAVKAGLDEPSYPHPSCASVLEETQGVIVYQEQVMQIAQRLAGYSLGEADMLRRAMGKKIQSEMEEQRERFIAGAAAGWINVQTEDGRTVSVHALSKVPLTDGSGMVTLQDALEQHLDVAL